MRRLTLLATILAVALVAFAAACGGDDDEGTAAGETTTGATTTEASFGDLSFTYASASDAIGIFKVVGDNMVSDAEKLGIEFKRYDNNLDGATALRNADLMIQDRPDLIIDWNAVAGVGAAVGQKFERAGIPCLAVNQQIPGCAWFNLSNQQMGVDAANIIVPEAIERGWTSENTTIFMVVASANGTEVNNGPRYFYITASEQMPGFEKRTPESINPNTTTIGGRQGVQIDCKSTVEGAYAAAKNVLPTIPAQNNILLYGSDTDCTLGAFRAIEEAGRAERTLTGGLGATPEGLQQLRTNPQWLVEGALFLAEWPQFILAMAVAMTQGVTPPELTAAPQVMLTKDTVDQYYDGNEVIQLPPLHESNEYLKDTGVLQQFGNVEGLDD